MGRIERKRGLRRPARAGQDQNAPAGGNAARSGEGAATLPTQNSGKNSGRPRGRVENLKPWPKGVSGNPGGRPRKQPITEAYLEVAGRTVPGDSRGRTYAQAAAERQFRAALKGSTSAIREIADRLEGKPQQRIEVTNVEDFLAGRSTEEKEFFAVHGYWPDDDAEKQKLQ